MMVTAYFFPKSEIKRLLSHAELLQDPHLLLEVIQLNNPYLYLTS